MSDGRFPCEVCRKEEANFYPPAGIWLCRDHARKGGYLTEDDWELARLPWPSASPDSPHGRAFLIPDWPATVDCPEGWEPLCWDTARFGVIMRRRKIQ